MYELENNPTALHIIQRSMTCHPSMFLEALQSRLDEDRRYASSRNGTVSESTLRAIIATAKAVERAIAIVESEDIGKFENDMGAGIVALGIACKLQILQNYVRTAAAIRTWGDV